MVTGSLGLRVHGPRHSIGYSLPREAKPRSTGSSTPLRVWCSLLCVNIPLSSITKKAYQDIRVWTLIRMRSKPHSGRSSVP